MCTFKEVKVQQAFRGAVQKGQALSQGNQHIVIDYGRLPTSFGTQTKHCGLPRGLRTFSLSPEGKGFRKARAGGQKEKKKELVTQ